MQPGIHLRGATDGFGHALDFCVASIWSRWLLPAQIIPFSNSKRRLPSAVDEIWDCYFVFFTSPLDFSGPRLPPLDVLRRNQPFYCGNDDRNPQKRRHFLSDSRLLQGVQTLHEKEPGSGFHYSVFPLFGPRLSSLCTTAAGTVVQACFTGVFRCMHGKNKWGYETGRTKTGSTRIFHQPKQNGRAIKALIKDLIILIRPKHWIKNVFVIAPLIFSFEFLEIQQVLRSIVAFACFSFTASSVYIVNDIIDRDNDRKHLFKRYRPLASGRLPLKHAVVLLLLLLAVQACLCFLFFPSAFKILAAYLTLNLLYSLYLKHIVIVDVFAIASGFVLRVVLGAAAVEVPLSEWMALLTFFLSLYFGFAKRYTDLNLQSVGRPGGQRSIYSKEIATFFMAICAALTTVLYTFYTLDPGVGEQFYPGRLLYSVPIVVFGLFRYFYLILHEKKSGDIADVITTDFFILAAAVLWTAQIIWSLRW